MSVLSAVAVDLFTNISMLASHRNIVVSSGRTIPVDSVVDAWFLFVRFNFSPVLLPIDNVPFPFATITRDKKSVTEGLAV
jgi:hypothetical protein